MHPDGFQDMTIARGIRCAAMRGPDRPAIVMDDRALSYRQLVRRIAQVSNLGREEFRLEMGDRVALIAPNCLEYVELVAGLAELGVIVATLSPRLTAAELSGIFDDCTPRLIIAHPDCADSILSGWAPVVFWLGDDFDRRREAARDVTPGRGVAETDPFALAYTSGTTGRPKGVLLSHRSRALTFAAMAAEYRCFGPDDNFLALAPMCHGAGFVFACAALHFGGTTTLFGSNNPEHLLERLGKRDISGVFMVPTHFARIFDLPKAKLNAYGDHGLRAIISNAAALPQAMKEAAIVLFGDGLLHETYGSTEGGIVTNIRPSQLRGKPGSVGLPFPHIEVELRTEDGTIAAPGEPGELFCRGPTLFNGYWNRLEATAETLVDGWVTVGDIATRDEDGFISIVDRKKDMVVTGGINVYPSEIERVIAQLPSVREVAVIGEPSREWGERLHAFVVSRAANAGNAAEIIASCREHLAGYKIPSNVTFLAELPRNVGGKVLKTALRDSIKP